MASDKNSSDTGPDVSNSGSAALPARERDANPSLLARIEILRDGELQIE